MILPESVVSMCSADLVYCVYRVSIYMPERVVSMCSAYLVYCVYRVIIHICMVAYMSAVCDTA